MSSRRAPFIAIEGLDRSGKTTQTSKLQERLQADGVNVKLMKFPDRTTAIGQMIDSYLRSASELDDRAIHLLFAANRWEQARSIEKDLENGITIICDRYSYSGIAFSASKVGQDRQPLLSYEWCKAPEIGLPAPDLVLFFDITPEKARERGGYGEERYEKEEMQVRVRGFYKRIGEELGDVWKVIDAGRDVDTVQQDVWTTVSPLLASYARSNAA